MRNLFSILVSLVLIIMGCNGQSGNSQSDNRYLEYKKEFDPLLTNHFPNRITSYPCQVIKSKDISKNDVGFLLYEYNVSKERLDSIVANLKGNLLGQYNSNDSCLLIVNRFETIDSFENRKEVEITDSSQVERPCYQSLYPIPNFIDYQNRTNDRPLKLNDNFTIYVMEAKSGRYFKMFDLQPSSQMPSLWKNGYSKGIAVSYKDKTVIYWGIIW